MIFTRSCSSILSCISKERVYRKIKSIDLDTFRNDLAVSELCQGTHKELNELVECFNKTLTFVLEKHAPLQRKIIHQRQRVQWYSDQILAAKRMRRKAERKWRSSNSTHDLKEYKSARNFATNFIKKARSDFYENLIQENSLDERKLFKISKQLLNQNFEVPFPQHVSKSMLANEMANLQYHTWPVDLIAWKRLAVCSRNVAIYITLDYIVRQTKNLAFIVILHDE